MSATASHHHQLRAAVRGELVLPASRRRPARGLPVLACLLLGLAAAGPLAAQVTYRQEVVPGFSSFDAGDDAAPELADLDGDGDVDVVAGNRAGRLQFFRNIGSPSAPVIAEIRGAGNPFDGIDVGDNAQPALADLDGDGDLDAVVGNAQGVLRYFANTGTAAAPAFAERTGSANPFAGIDAGDYSAPELADLDGDGDVDAVVGSNASRPRYFANTGNAAAPAFVLRTGSANPFPVMDPLRRIDPQLVDIDLDGDLDLAVGLESGGIFYFRNTGSSTEPFFLLQAFTSDPFSGSTSATTAAWLSATSMATAIPTRWPARPSAACTTSNFRATRQCPFSATRPTSRIPFSGWAGAARRPPARRWPTSMVTATSTRRSAPAPAS